MNAPIVYLSLAFFDSFFENRSKPYDELGAKSQTISYVDELLIEKGRVYINCAKESIEMLLSKEVEDLPASQRKKALYLRRIFNGQKPRYCTVEMEVIRQQKYADFNMLQQQPHVALLADSEEFCRRIELDFGIVCIGKTLTRSITLCRSESVSFKKDEQVNIGAASYCLPKSNTIIIEDPQLFDNDKKGEFLLKLLKALTDGVKVDVFITIIVTIPAISHVAKE